ncbi:MAG: hypothetical protein K2G38_04125 [Clostridia bacterium]|nr:hypothetical protein [Clostridia bacterium]
MLIKDVIISVLRILGRNELASAVADNAVLTAEEKETVTTLLYCFNAVESEMAVNYLPLTEKKELESATGKYFLFLLDHTPTRIIRVTAGGKEVEYELYPEFIITESKAVVIEYEYAPAKKNINDSSEYGKNIGERAFACGVAAEYCLINGETEAADIWEAKYRKAVDKIQAEAAQSGKKTTGGYIPPRRWV